MKPTIDARALEEGLKKRRDQALARLRPDGAGRLSIPDPAPEDADELLDLMDAASLRAADGQGAGAPTFDHNMRVFHQLYARLEVMVARDLAASHGDLETATKRLSLATWWLAAVSVLLLL